MKEEHDSYQSSHDGNDYRENKRYSPERDNQEIDSINEAYDIVEKRNDFHKFDLGHR